MQIVIALPEMSGIETSLPQRVRRAFARTRDRDSSQKRRRQRSSLIPPAVQADRQRSRLKTNLLAATPIETILLEKALDSDRPGDWAAIDAHLHDRFSVASLEFRAGQEGT